MDMPVGMCNVYVYILGYVCTCMLVWVVLCVCARPCASMSLGVRVNLWVSVCLSYSTRIRSRDSNPIIEDSDSIRICARYGPDGLAIRKLTHEIIRRFVPVRAVKIRR